MLRGGKARARAWVTTTPQPHGGQTSPMHVPGTARAQPPMHVPPDGSRQGLVRVCVLRVNGAADANRARVRGRANDAHSATRDRVCLCVTLYTIRYQRRWQ